jgi:hypothetical protein
MLLVGFIQEGLPGMGGGGVALKHAAWETALPILASVGCKLSEMRASLAASEASRK